MDTQYVQMEVLLITGTTLLSQDLCGKDEPGTGNHLSANEQLEKACWDGLLASLLPEVFDQPIRDNHLYLWGVKSLSLSCSSTWPRRRYLRTASSLSTPIHFFLRSLIIKLGGPWLNGVKIIIYSPFFNPEPSYEAITPSRGYLIDLLELSFIFFRTDL